MQYKIPQNVQIEDKIVGPLTMKQLIICGIWGGLTYIVYLSLAKVYYIEIWIGPVVILGLFTLAFAFLKIHDIPFLKYVLLLIEYSQNAQKRKWMSLGSEIKSLIALRPAQENKSKKEAVAEKTINSLSDVSRLLDRNNFEHIQHKIDASIDNVSDKYLLHDSFTSKSETELEAHEERLKELAKNPTKTAKQGDETTISVHQLKKGSIEFKLPRK